MTRTTKPQAADSANLDGLLKSEALLKKTFHESPNAMCLNQINNAHFRSVNLAFENLTGYKLDELIAKTPVDLGILTSAELEDLLQFMQRHQDQGHKEITFLTKSGETRNVVLYYDQVTFKKKHYFLFTINDITRRKQMETEMQQLDRLSLISDMAISLAHHIRNPLTTVKGYLQLLQRKADLSAYWSRFATMVEEMDMINRIITEFITLAKNKAVHREHNHLNQLLQALFPLLEAEALMQGKTLTMKLQAIPTFQFDEKELTQLILHMARNGLEAMPTGGKLTLKTSVHDNSILLTIQDEGTGIAKEVLEQLGRPFLTTKATGIGLGLAICQQIVSHHQAHLSYATSNKGTIFTIAFPF